MMMRARSSEFGFISLMILLLIISKVDPVSGSTFRKLKEGDPVPSFTLNDLQGKEFTFTPDDGALKLLAFVSIEKNEKSKKLLEDLGEIYEEMSAKGVKVIAVVSYENKIDEIKSFVDEKKLSYPIVVDSAQEVYGDWGLFVLPATAIVKGDGKLAFEYSSYDTEYKNVVGGRAKVLAGVMTEEEYGKLVRPLEEPEKSMEEKEATRLITLGKRLASKGMHEKAAVKFKEAVDKDPENLEARTLYAESMGKAGEVESAISELNAVLEKNPNFRDAKIALGIVLIEKGDFDGAVENLTSASMLNPRPQRAYYWLGTAYEKKGDLENAVKYYKKALKKVLGE